MVAGLVVARQRPATANGIVFLLLEDETGMINAIVQPDVYDRHRAVARAEPLVVVWGRLERRERVTNVLVHRMERIEPPLDDRALPQPDLAEEVTRARMVAPIGQSFGRGRR